MKNIFYGIVLGIVFTPFLAYSSNNILIPDSVGIKAVAGSNFIIHKVEAKQGWYSISKRYGVEQDEIKAANPKVTDLQIGQLILVPIVAGATPNTTPVKTEVIEIQTPQPKTEEKFKTPVYHTVKKGETLYSISKNYNSSISDIKTWNKINNDLVNMGQKLIVNYVFAYNNGETKSNPVKVEEPPVTKPVVETKPENVPVVEDKKGKKDPKKTEPEKTVYSEPRPIMPGNKPSSETSDANKSTTKPNVQIVEPGPQLKLRAVTETGVAAWIEDDDINPNKFFALHRTAPSGTIIRVKNKMNGSYVYVKVVGILPDTGDNSNLIIKLSKAAAVKLGVIDAKFQTELNFGVHDDSLEEKFR